MTPERLETLWALIPDEVKIVAEAAADVAVPDGWDLTPCYAERYEPAELYLTAPGSNDDGVYRIDRCPQLDLHGEDEPKWYVGFDDAGNCIHYETAQAAVDAAIVGYNAFTNVQAPFVPPDPRLKIAGTRVRVVSDHYTGDGVVVIPDDPFTYGYYPVSPGFVGFGDYRVIDTGTETRCVNAHNIVVIDDEPGS